MATTTTRKMMTLVLGLGALALGVGLSTATGCAAPADEVDESSGAVTAGEPREESDAKLTPGEYASKGTAHGVSLKVVRKVGRRDDLLILDWERLGRNGRFTYAQDSGYLGADGLVRALTYDDGGSGCNFRLVVVDSSTVRVTSECGRGGTVTLEKTRPVLAP